MTLNLISDKSSTKVAPGSVSDNLGSSLVENKFPKLVECKS